MTGKKDAGVCFIPPKGDYVRCPSCGGMVQMPCLTCYISSGNHYPDCVSTLFHKPGRKAKTRQCIVCHERKSIKRFGLESCGQPSERMIYRTCQQCRTNFANEGQFTNYGNEDDN